MDFFFQLLLYYYYITIILLLHQYNVIITITITIAITYYPMSGVIRLWCAHHAMCFYACNALVLRSKPFAVSLIFIAELQN